MTRRSAVASPSTLAAVRHLARLGVTGWVLIAVLVGGVLFYEHFAGAETDPPAPPAEGVVVADRTDGWSPDDDPGPPPRSDRRPVPPPVVADAPVEPPTRPRATYAVVTVTLETRAGEKVVDLDPDAVLARADGGGLASAAALRGGERLKTDCAEPVTVASAKAVRVAAVRPPPRCAPVVVEAYLKGVTVENFGRAVPAAAPGGELDLTATLVRIAKGESFPHRNDGGVFGNRERRLPRQASGYYREYVHPTPGVSGPGPQRLVIGKGGDVWYTPDHYDSFRAVVAP